MKQITAIALVVIVVSAASGRLSGQTNVWQPSPGHTQVPIWPGPVPNPESVPGPEAVLSNTNWVVAGKAFVFVVNVSQPTMTVYAPKGTNTGVAVIVCPGGGYNALAMDLEGTEICEWLTSRAITAVLLKYRVPTPKVGRYKESIQALQDAQRTLNLVRFNASNWQIDSRKIGIIGFSAGGHLVAAASTRFDKRSYPPVDAADQLSCRPDFAIALYPGHLSPWYADDTNAWTNIERLGFNPNITVSSNSPPTFLLHAQDDPVDDVRNSMAYSLALRNAKVPAELH